MKFIAHRGNIDGPDKQNENNPQHILGALSFGFYVEVDVWSIEGQYYLGHDEPTYRIDVEFLHNTHILSHIKNVYALERVITDPQIHFFCHDTDDYALTSNNLVVVYPGKIVPVLPRHSIVMMPESQSTGFDLMSNVKQIVKSSSRCFGICSDYARFCKEIKEGLHD